MRWVFSTWKKMLLMWRGKLLAFRWLDGDDDDDGWWWWGRWWWRMMVVEGKVTRVQVHFDENKPGYVHDCLYHEFIQAFICSLIQSLLSLTLLESWYLYVSYNKSFFLSIMHSFMHPVLIPRYSWSRNELKKTPGFHNLCQLIQHRILNKIITFLKKSSYKFLIYINSKSLNSNYNYALHSRAM